MQNFDLNFFELVVLIVVMGLIAGLAFISQTSLALARRRCHSIASDDRREENS